MTKPLRASTLNILEPGSQTAHGLPLFRLGFRPFYLCAAYFGAMAIPVWVLSFLGYIAWQPAIPALFWHAHEMLFGFAGAVIVGFLLTAGKAWTGLATPRGAKLATLVALWVAARLAAVLAPYAVFALLDVALLPIIAVVLVTLFIRANSIRNLPIAGILVLLAVANGAFHLAVLGFIRLSPLDALHAGLALVVMLECVIAGRVIPGFTLSANPGLKIRGLSALEAITLGSTLIGLGLWVFLPPHALTAGVLLLAAASHVVRQWRWSPLVSRKRPILWILHAAYAWMPLALGLLAMSQLGWVSPSAGLHALTVGVTGGLIIAMVTRTARGHTGRVLQASRAEVVAYALVMLAATARVVLPLVAANWMASGLLMAAACWAAAFGIYAVVYTPWLAQARVDGKDG
ncbi:MAG: short-chain dehydrogenase [Burkholderiales bacterium PBB3]|nr:MAG: short-chain dehydrogenase [Burkholderiales bacterium PBB3]